MINRSLWVDYAKAIGIILVVYGHVARGIYNAGIPINESIYNLADSIVYTFHMPLFFFLSGLFFYGSFQKRGTGKFILSKVDTIVYPYLIWSVVQGCIEAFLSSYTNGTVTYSDVFSLLWMPRAQFWFLYSLFMIFIISSVIFKWVKPKYFGLVFIGSSILYIMQNNISQFFHINTVANNFVFFVFGIILIKYANSKFLNSNKLLPLTMVLFAGLQYILHYHLGLTYENKGLLTLIIALVSIVFIFAISKLLEKCNKKIDWLLFIGSSSMAIYIMHILAASGTRVIMKNILNINSVSIHIIVGCLVGIVAPLIAVYIIKKFKIPFVFSAPISKYITKPKV